MNLNTLRAAGTLLYGEYWQSPLARDLGVPLRTFQRCVAEGQLPAQYSDMEKAEFWAELADMCETRGVELCALALTLKGGRIAEVGE